MYRINKINLITSILPCTGCSTTTQITQKKKASRNEKAASSSLAEPRQREPVSPFLTSQLLSFSLQSGGKFWREATSYDKRHIIGEILFSQKCAKYAGCTKFTDKCTKVSIVITSQFSSFIIHASSSSTRVNRALELLWCCNAKCNARPYD